MTEPISRLTTDKSRPALVARMQDYAASIFGVTSARAVAHGAVNLGQGFPDIDGPEELKQLACQAIVDGSGNQYPPAHGLPDLRAAISEHQQRFYRLEVDPDSEVVVTTGASEALTATFLGLLDPGDEVIILEPFFDVYPAGIALANARHVSVPLQIVAGAGWHGDSEVRGFRLDAAALRDAITPATKMLVINSPHNPTGMVFTEWELAEIAAIAIEHDLIVLSDEAYEHLVFEPARHIPIATLPGMFERTITIGSGGKCFSFTGWKVGWATGPANLIHAVRVARQHMSYVSGGPFQPAIAAGLRLPDSYFEALVAQFKERHDQLAAGLRAAGFEVFQTDGTYFITSDTRFSAGGTEATASTGDTSESVAAASIAGLANSPAPTATLIGDREFCDLLLTKHGVATIPCSALVDHTELFPNYVRWAFCKQEAVITEALNRLR